MSKQFNTYRVGIESMTETQLGWWEKKGVTYKPILEYNPLSKEETSRLAGGRTGEILGMISVTDLTAGFDSLLRERTDPTEQPAMQFCTLYNSFVRVRVLSLWWR